MDACEDENVCEHDIVKDYVDSLADENSVNCIAPSIRTQSTSDSLSSCMLLCMF
jgi:hypothetical protein